MDAAVRAYIDDLPLEHRALFDRMNRVVLEAHPEADLVISYKIPTYVAGRRRLHVGMWKHGLSLYGWGADRDAGFLARHPELHHGRGTIRLPLLGAENVSDAELRDLAKASLDP